MNVGIKIYFGLIVAMAIAPSSSPALIQITKVTGASASELAQKNSIIYGGLAGIGAAACISSDGIEPCNGCASADHLQVCNRRRIDPQLRLSVTLKSNKAAGFATLVGPDGSIVATNSQSTKVGQVTNVAVPWGTLCAQVNGGHSDCSVAGTQTGTFRIGFSSNQSAVLEDETEIKVITLNPDLSRRGFMDAIDDCDTLPGVCHFETAPSSGGIDLHHFKSGPRFPITMAGVATAVRLYASTGDFIRRPGEIEPVHFDLVKQYDRYLVRNPTIRGLKKGETYFLRTSSVDAAGNEFLFTSDQLVFNECGTRLNPVHCWYVLQVPGKHGGRP
jgi:hypothetical protein